MKKGTALITALVLLMIGQLGFGQRRNASTNEIIYHVFQRSFYDSNGDLHGDLKGLNDKLDYLQELGVTSILLLPLYKSVYYHNYFADDFESIDPTLGSMEDYLALVKNVHRRGMKIYMDMETQYVTEDHLWYKDSYHNPKSLYTDYLFYNGPENTQPESIIFNLTELTGYNGVVRKITTVNLNSRNVLEYNYKLFSHWVDPNNDGKFDDSIDGFRIDHMMDDLDGKGKFKDLFTNFWSPLFARLKKINSNLIITAEQANWGSLGLEYMQKGGIDRVFAFKLLWAIASFDKVKLAALADSTFSLTPEGKQQIVFIENHDMQRFASSVRQDPGRLRVGAALNLLLGGVPSIYYGQELGMTGAGGFNKFGNTDGNDIPQREAFRWYKEVEGKGMALWYKNTGPWWTQTNLKPNDGISLEEQKNDSSSLWNYYVKMIALRKNHPVFGTGRYQTVKNNNDKVFSFIRKGRDEEMTVIVNLSGEKSRVHVEFAGSKTRSSLDKTRRLLGEGDSKVTGAGLEIELLPFGVQVWKTE